DVGELHFGDASGNSCANVARSTYDRHFAIHVWILNSTIAHRPLLGHVPTSSGDRSTDFVENPVEKIVQNGVRRDQVEHISGWHHRGAIADTIDTSNTSTKPTDYTVTGAMKILIADGLPSSALHHLQQPDWTVDAKQG